MPEKNSEIDIRAILGRIKRVEGETADAGLSGPLNTTKRNIVSWKQRGTIPWEAITQWAAQRGVSLDWVLLEKGPMWSDEIGLAEPGAYYRVKTNCDPAYKLAGMLHEAMQEAGVTTTAPQFEASVNFLHRDIIESGGEPEYEKVLSLVKLFRLGKK